MWGGNASNPVYLSPKHLPTALRRRECHPAIRSKLKLAVELVRRPLQAGSTGADLNR